MGNLGGLVTSMLSNLWEKVKDLITSLGDYVVEKAKEGTEYVVRESYKYLTSKKAKEDAKAAAHYTNPVSSGWRY